MRNNNNVSFKATPTDKNISISESDRLENLFSYQILDTLPEKFYDDITRLASLICEAPMAVISLTDEQRQWVKSAVGIDVQEAPRELSFCHHAIKQDKVYEVENASTNALFRDNPYTKGPASIQFYAGAPLKSSEGYNLGTLCVMDTQPKALSQNQKDALVILSQSVMAQMELSKKQRELQEEKRLAEQLLDSVPLGICVSDLRGGLKYANSKASAMLKIDGGNMTAKKNINSFIKKKLINSKDSTHPFDKALAGEHSYTNDLELKSGNEIIPLQMWNTPIYNRKGEIKSIITALDDITADRNIRKALEESEENYRNLIEDAGDVYYTSDWNGNFTYINSRVETLTGYLPEELIGKHYTSLIAPESVSETTNFYMQQFASVAEETRLEFPIVTKDGRKKWVEQTVRLKKDNNGRILQFRSVVRDTDVRKQAEQEIIKAKQAAEEAKKLQERFLANMSHEIRTPMNGVLGMAHLLSETNIDEQQQEYIQAIITCGNNLLVIINDILDFSKIQAGRINLEEIAFNIHDTIKTALFSVKHKAKEKGLSLFSETDETLHPYLYGDPTRLTQILTNLIGNAIKFTNSGTVKVKIISVGEDKTQTTIQFTVEDTGIGIAEEHLSLIYEDFMQATSDINRKFGGTGLGLSISRQLIEIQGGNIKVKSKVGEGTAFVFEITYKKSEQHHLLQSLSGSKKNLKGIKILVAEDNIMNQMVASHTIEKWNATVEIAEDGLKALQKLEESEFDLILMDLHMPEMDGNECTTSIRNHPNPKIANIPIIAMTASAFKSEKNKCLNSGMNGYISKPLYPQDLYDQIVNCMEKAR